MTTSTKIIMRIMLGSAGLAGIFLLIDELNGNKGKTIEGMWTFFAIIGAVTFIAFLISLIVSSSKGK